MQARLDEMEAKLMSLRKRAATAGEDSSRPGYADNKTQQGFDLTHPLNILKHFEAEQGHNNFLIVIVYRGIWSPYCLAYLQEWESVATSVREAGGELLAVSADSSADAVKIGRGLRLSFQCIGDPARSLARAWQKRNLITVLNSLEHTPWLHTVHPNLRQYVMGCYLPAVLAVDSTGTVLYKYACRPEMRNLYGVGSRPIPSDTLNFVLMRLQHLISQSKESKHKQLFSDTKDLGGRQQDDVDVDSNLGMLGSSSPQLPVHNAWTYVPEHQLGVWLTIATLIFAVLLREVMKRFG